MKTFKQLVAEAEKLSDDLAALTSPIEAAAWAIDESLSAVRKDKAGYRIGTKAERDGGGSYVDGELEQAVKRGQQLLQALAFVEALETRWAAEDRHATARRNAKRVSHGFIAIGSAH